MLASRDRKRRRQSRWRTGVIAALAVLAVAATGVAGLFWQELKRNEALLEATLKLVHCLDRGISAFKRSHETPCGELPQHAS